MCTGGAAGAVQREKGEGRVVAAALLRAHDEGVGEKKTHARERAKGARWGAAQASKDTRTTYTKKKVK